MQLPKSGELAGLEPKAAEVAIDRLRFESAVFRLIWPTSAALVLLGVGAISWGMVRAWRRQLASDENEDRALRPATSVESDEKRQSELLEAVAAEVTALNTENHRPTKLPTKESVAERIDDVERLLASRIGRIYWNASLEVGAAVDTPTGPAQADMALEFPGGRRYLVEVKYSKIYSSSILRSAARQLGYMIRALDPAGERDVRGIIVIVISGDTPMSPQELSQKLREVTQGWSAELLGCLSVAYFDHSELESLNDDEFKGRLSLSP